ncbi:hypothetical protein GCM10008018_26530 [Paenibacillus marchantiophytorum]|uniref:Uncharacterized protein n=1 Tax=Paenibacillus marchantiophytorum TaxID=1619310 RepID=A0ABQ1ENR3_9BACL|nr:hypothetical protein GCM10008018_26530 [Paenibacillus marchantiophytorum]
MAAQKLAYYYPQRIVSFLYLIRLGFTLNMLWIVLCGMNRDGAASRGCTGTTVRYSSKKWHDREREGTTFRYFVF